MKSYIYGKVEVLPENKKKKKKKEEKSLLDYAIEQKDYQLADELMKDARMKSFDTEAINSKIDKLEKKIDRLANPEIAHIIANHIVKKFHEGEE